MADIQINPNNYFGNDYDAFRTELYGFAISDPKSYLVLRRKVLDSIRNAQNEVMYKTIRALLRDGKNLDGDDLFVFNGTSHSPKYPAQKIQELSLGAAETINEMMGNIGNIILPISINEIMSKQLAKIGEGQNPQNA